MHTIIMIDSSTDLDQLRNALADSQAHRLRVTVDSEGVKFKVNGGMWSPPMGRLDPECEAAQAISQSEVMSMSPNIVQDDNRARNFTCDNCNASPGEKCSEPTNSGRKKVAYIHTARIEALRKYLDSLEVAEPYEPEICSCGRHYNGITCEQYESMTGG